MSLLEDRDLADWKQFSFFEPSALVIPRSIISKFLLESCGGWKGMCERRGWSGGERGGAGGRSSPGGVSIIRGLSLSLSLCPCSLSCSGR